MTALIFLFCLLGDESGLPDMLASHRYLDAAKVLKNDAHQLVSPEAVRRYSVLVVEYHSRQLAFRNFFIRNLAAGESLRQLRGSQEMVGGPNIGLIEEDMEALLERAWKKFPNDRDIRFARAVYAFNGTCCFIKPKIRFKHSEIIATFREAEACGIRCGSSMWALALDEMAREKPDRKLLTQFLEKAHQLNAEDPNIYLAYVNDLLSRREYQLSLPHARNLYEMALTPQERVESLAAVARAYAGQKKPDKAMEAVKGGLAINGQHSLLWMVGLECLREAVDETAYTRHIADFLNQAPEKPSFFRVYLDYMRRKGMTKPDELFLDNYQLQTEGTPLARITRHVNMADFFLWRQEWDKAAAEVEQARAISKEMNGTDPRLTKVLDDMAQAARKH